MNTPLLEARLQQHFNLPTLWLFSILFFNTIIEHQNTLSTIIICSGSLFLMIQMHKGFYSALFFDNEVQVNLLIKKQHILYDEIDFVRIKGFGIGKNYRTFIFLKTGSKLVFTEDNFWTEDLCNVMYQKGVRIELVKKANENIRFDKDSERYSIKSRQPRNEKEHIRKMKIFA
ncbi:hypothetical protein [Lishizhenia sp.]|uniref:hypothetical protein n=1 Tax=Lishizhenia sp. TaxID=2497594 RepID=UPI00299DA4B7|nr:hypothetical protein [Lishizhenia sp.]MDX1447327.1 hypothetical protein [Lishizhenia sp.]